jgi:cis-3-alkyl-4-acyloxetan-2-one decarboxylase
MSIFSANNRLVDTIWHRVLRRPYKLSVEDVGTGKPIVLLHGVGASKQVWAPLIKKLDQTKWRVIAVDLLGFGTSPRPDWNPYDVREHSKSVRATLKRLKIAGPITLVGHSMGCLVAAHLAARRPKSIERLVLYEPPLFADSEEFSKHKSIRDRYFKVFEYMLVHPKMLLTHKRLLKLVRKFYGVAMSEDDWLPFERSLRNTIMQQRLYNDLKGIKILTDIIYGRLDFIVTRAQVAAMFETQANIRLHIVSGMHSVSARAAGFIARLLG